MDFDINAVCIEMNRRIRQVQFCSNPQLNTRIHTELDGVCICVGEIVCMTEEGLFWEVGLSSREMQCVKEYLKSRGLYFGMCHNMIKEWQESNLCELSHI